LQDPFEINKTTTKRKGKRNRDLNHCIATREGVEGRNTWKLQTACRPDLTWTPEDRTPRVVAKGKWRSFEHNWPEEKPQGNLR